MGFIALGLSVGTEAHVPANRTLAAFHIADEQVPVIDGDLGDWEGLGDAYAIEEDEFTDLILGADTERDATDFSAQVKIAWNATFNRLYIAARVVDDVHQIDRPADQSSLLIFQDDDLEIFLDADHSGGQYADFSELSQEEQLRQNGAEANHFVVAGPPPDDVFFVNFSAASWYALEDGPFTAAAYALDGQIGGPAVMTYEVMLAPFATINMGASFLSVPHVLAANQILGFNIEFNDFDAFSTILDAKWSLSGGQNAFKFSHRFTDLLLLPPADGGTPTAVTQTSWAHIKAAFEHARLGQGEFGHD